MPSKTSNRKPVKRLEFEAIGTSWLITSATTIDAQTQQQIQARIAEFDHNYSRFKADSWLRQVGSKPGSYVMPADAQPLFDIYQQLYALTYGAMTPLIGQTLAEAGYDEQYSLKPGTITSLPTWDHALNYNFPELTTKHPLLLDVGAAGKGYLVDIVSALLQLTGHADFVVNAGGDLRVFGVSQTIGLENPFDASELIGEVTLQNASLCGSAGNRRRWANFTHIINPQTLNSATNIAAVWVIADTALLADGLSTALYFAKPEQLLERYQFEYLLVFSDHSTWQSSRFPALYH